MDFTLYTMGDVEIMRAALAGVAMVFSPDGFFTSNEGFGLGAMAGLGLLVALLVALVMGVVRQRVEVGQFIVLIAVFFVMFVPKVRVQVEDYYSSGQIAAIDNVPLGVAFPIAFMSGVTRATNDRLATGYQTVSGSPYVEMTSPLKLLNGMRNASMNMPAIVTGGPELRQTIQDYAIFCMAGRPELLEANWDSITLKTGMVDAINKVNTNGLSLDYTKDPQGVLTPCADLRQSLANLFSGFYASDLERVLNGNMSNTLVVRSGQAQPVTIADYETAFKAVTNGDADVAQKFALFQAFNPAILSGLNCADKVADKREMAECLPLLYARNAWAEDQAAAGTTFQRIMFHSMNLLLFMFICMAPVVAIMMLVKGWGGLRVAGGYLLFGAWSQSWFIGATIVNFYIQQTILYEITAAGGIEKFTYGMQLGLFGVLTDKMALAGNMIASTPLMMMAIMGGSAYGLVNMASRAGGADYYDEKQRTAQYVQPSALMSRTAMAQGSYGSGVEDLRYAGGASISLRDAVGWKESASIASEQRLSQEYHSGISNLIAKQVGTDKESSLRTTLAERVGSEAADRMIADARASKGAGITFKGETGDTSALGQIHATATKLDAGISGQLGLKGKPRKGPDQQVGPGMTQPGSGTVIPSPISGGASAGASIATQDQTTDEHRSTISTATSATDTTELQASKSSSHAGAFTTGLSWDQARSVGQALHEKYAEDWKREFGERESAIDSFMSRSSQERSVEEIVGGQRTIESGQMVNALVASPETVRHLRSAGEIAATTGPHAEEYRAIRKTVAAEYGRKIAGSDPQASEALFDFVALDRFGARYNDGLAQTAHTAAAYDLFGMHTARHDAPTSLRADANEGIAGGAWDGKSATAPQRQSMKAPAGAGVPGTASVATTKVRGRYDQEASAVDAKYTQSANSEQMRRMKGAVKTQGSGSTDKPASTWDNVEQGWGGDR